MIESRMIRFEASGITADALDGTAVLTMKTVENGHVAVHMQRDVLVALAVEVQCALDEEQPSVDRG